MTITTISKRRSVLHAAVAVAAVAVAAALLAACGGGGATDATTTAPSAHDVNDAAAALVPNDIRAKGILHVASSQGYPPFEFYATDNKTLVGADAEIVRAVADSLDLNMELKVVGFDAIIPGMQGGRYDVAIAAMGITPERNKVVDFISYFEGGTSIMTPAGNPKGLALDTLCGHTVAVQKGTIYADNYLPSFSAACTADGNAAIQMDVYPDSSAATVALSSGRAEATMDDFGPLAYVARASNGKFSVLDANYEPAPYGIAVPRDSALAPAIQSALKALIADGTYMRILSKWGLSAGALTDPAVSRG